MANITRIKAGDHKSDDDSKKKTSVKEAVKIAKEHIFSVYKCSIEKIQIQGGSARSGIKSTKKFHFI